MMLATVKSYSRKFNISWYRNIISLPEIRISNQNDISALSEVKQRTFFREQLKLKVDVDFEKLQRFNDLGLKKEGIKAVVEAGLATFLLHVEARIASSVGQGFYTIGPCGEEIMATIGLNLNENDSCALHYRHVSMSILRQLKRKRNLNDILLDRARGFTCSTLDPVTGGRHCAIGGSQYDYLVTSTLASQCPPAVGRALGIGLSHHISKSPTAASFEPTFAKNAISFVSLGEGSANNAHFLAAANLAENSQYNKRKCPIVFCITDNGMSISLRDNGWIHQLYNRFNMPKFVASAHDFTDIYDKSKQAIDHARQLGRPALLVVTGLSRRFGHAATDRQIAYMSTDEIRMKESTNDFYDVCQLAVASGVISQTELLHMYDDITVSTERAFDVAVNEPKLTSRVDLVASNSSPLAAALPVKDVMEKSSAMSNARPDNMRKHMTALYGEFLEKYSNGVYIGEDVRHGGYYLVTEGLAAKYPFKIHDFPPDETTLVGAGQGLSQSGLLPVVEIPYAKYLDCGLDMLNEIILTQWLSGGTANTGMIVRLQGFDKGKFGGNFHTHNMISIPPGLDVVCYSNGSDYVRGIRYSIRQAAVGRIVMSIDSTDLLNRRHLGVKDDLWLTQFPLASQTQESELDFDQIGVYSGTWKNGSLSTGTNRTSVGIHQNSFLHFLEKYSADIMQSEPTVVIVTYGNALPTSLLAADELVQKGIVSSKHIYVVDCPYLSSPPKQLLELFSKLSRENTRVVFADVCKEGSGMPLAGFAINLQNQLLLPSKWKVVGSTPTYNPLGQLVTFISSDDIESTVISML